jgi:Protein of unknown function (DUF3040)
MEVLATRAMRLHAKERPKLHQIEEDLRKDDPGLDTLLAGRPPPRRRVARAPAVWVRAPYLVPPALFLTGLLLHATWLVLGGVVLCPFIPVLTWLLIRRHLVHGVPSHRRKP